ncbi:MAG: excinuclease ATPase subunit [Marinobacter sp.]|uniref:excinuclease ATPase subunit n=1 Tax=Marinobacter sp. TaxID=50741 RepID=UPI003F94D213
MKLPVLAAAILALTFSTTALGRDTKHLLPLEDAMNTPDAQQKLDGSIKFYFADEAHPQITQKIPGVTTNRKTNAFMKSDEEACSWVFLSAMIALQERAQQEGADAVVNITSYYDRQEMASRDDYECHAGAVLAGVALKGDIVKFAD